MIPTPTPLSTPELAISNLIFIQDCFHPFLNIKKDNSPQCTMQTGIVLIKTKTTKTVFEDANITGPSGMTFGKWQVDKYNQIPESYMHVLLFLLELFLLFVSCNIFPLLHTMVVQKLLRQHKYFPF